MAQRVVVQIQMKTIKRYSFAGFLTCLFLALFVALPIVEFFMPISYVTNFSYVPQVSQSFTMFDVIKSGLKMDDGKLLQLFVNQVPVYKPGSQAEKFYNLFQSAMPYVMLGGMIVFFVQALCAIVALILIIDFLVRGRWTRFTAPSFFSHFGMWSSFFILLLGNGLIIFSTVTGVGGYQQMSNAYLVYEFPGWLYSLIYFGAGLIGFIGIFFCREYGFADRVYIGKNRRPNEPDVHFFDKENYESVTEIPSSDETSKEEKPVDAIIPVENTANEETVTETSPEPSESDPIPEEKKENKDVIVGTTVIPTKPKVEPEPCKGIPQDIPSIGGHAFSENQNVIFAIIPTHIDKLGDAAFSNCLNLTTVEIHKGLKSIGSNCFFNCARLKKINYKGTKAEWKAIKRGSNWLLKAGTKVVNCSDGPVQVNPFH